MVAHLEVPRSLPRSPDRSLRAPGVDTFAAGLGCVVGQEPDVFVGSDSERFEKESITEMVLAGQV